MDLITEKTALHLRLNVTIPTYFIRHHRLPSVSTVRPTHKNNLRNGPTSNQLPQQNRWFTRNYERVSSSRAICSRTACSSFGSRVYSFMLLTSRPKCAIAASRPLASASSAR